MQLQNRGLKRWINFAENFLHQKNANTSLDDSLQIISTASLRIIEQYFSRNDFFLGTGCPLQITLSVRLAYILYYS